MDIYADTRPLTLLTNASRVRDFAQGMQFHRESGFRKIFLELITLGLVEIQNLNRNCFHLFERGQLDYFDQECCSCGSRIFDPVIYKEIYSPWQN